MPARSMRDRTAASVNFSSNATRDSLADRAFTRWLCSEIVITVAAGFVRTGMITSSNHCRTHSHALLHRGRPYVLLAKLRSGLDGRTLTACRLWKHVIFPCSGHGSRRDAGPCSKRPPARRSQIRRERSARCLRGAALTRTKLQPVKIVVSDVLPKDKSLPCVLAYKVLCRSLGGTAMGTQGSDPHPTPLIRLAGAGAPSVSLRITT